MPTAAVRYGTIRLTGAAWSVPLTAPVDDLLAAGDLAATARVGPLPVGAHRALAIARRYSDAQLFPVELRDAEDLWRDLLAVRVHGVLGAFELVEPGARAAEQVLTYFERLVAQGVPDMFLRSAGLGQERKVSAELAPFLERLTFRADGGVDAPTWLELGAWALDTAARTCTFTVDACALCGVPFLRTSTSPYCRRVALHAWQTCAEIAKVREHRARKRAFARGAPGDEPRNRTRRRGS